MKHNKPSKDSKNSDLEKNHSFFVSVLINLGKFFWFVIRIPYFLVKYLILFFKFLFKKDKNIKKGIIKDSGVVSNFKSNINLVEVLESFKGTYESFFDSLKKNDSFIAIAIGARGSGKTAVSLSFLESLYGSKKHYYALGFSQTALPNWILLVNDVSFIKNDSLVVVDEGGILFSSRESMSDANKILSDLLMISRHKNISIIFISQNSSNLEINTLRQADFLILKKNSLLQKNFERKIIAKIYDEYDSYFAKYKSKGATLIYSDSFIGVVNVNLPSFWSDKTSKSFENLETQSRVSKKSKK